ncbi:helix-turn-helix transcriptional regulator [Paracoccus sp. M683]|uniref:winged helix-turn-helix transcriptional regulator n=1 Tax=Paracoccus sp. M683 TaxID=2594268 RepID=UPI00117E3A7F|nr:helix-turn-helix domain-containing protein [Paracoccus sp. M683]TRW98171.1 helix-turn-helix transcriptional regulator [Paracoccus sp. M683]
MTKNGETPRIRYDEGCLAAHALNVIGDRWALLVARELMLTPKRFQAIRAGLPGITAAVLTQRLGQLAEAGVVQHDAALGIYGLTASGKALYPVLIALCHWGNQHPGHDPRRFISPTALMISMTANVDAQAAQGADLIAGFQSGREGFEMRLATSGAAEVQAVAQPAGDFRLHGDGNALAYAVYGPMPLTHWLDRGTIGLTGDLDKAQRFIDLFSLRRDG